MYSSMKKAEKVLKILKKRIGSKEDGLCYQPFQNGREHGFSILNFNANAKKQVSFSENRNSDEIVVYYGTAYETFDINNLPMTDEDWKRKKYFEPEEYEEAAEFILEKLMSESAVSLV